MDFDEEGYAVHGEKSFVREEDGTEERIPDYQPLLLLLDRWGEVGFETWGRVVALRESLEEFTSRDGCCEMQFMGGRFDDFAVWEESSVGGFPWFVMSPSLVAFGE